LVALHEGVLVWQSGECIAALVVLEEGDKNTEANDPNEEPDGHIDDMVEAVEIAPEGDDPVLN
jgi:hypothetical protein